MPEASQDERLRRHGFEIHSRPSKGPVLWKRGRRIYTEAEALKICAGELESVAAAKK